MVASSSFKSVNDCRHFQRMGKVGIARCPCLRTVRLHRIDIGAVQKILVRILIVGGNLLHKLELTHLRLDKRTPIICNILPEID